MFAHVMSLFMHVSAYNNNLIINMIINTKWIFAPKLEDNQGRYLVTVTK